MSTPAFKVEADGSDVTAKIQDRLLSLDLSDKAGSKSDRLSITIDDRDQVVEMPKKGVKLKLSLGFLETGVKYIGTYVVDDVEVGGPIRTMTIRASSADMGGGIKAPKERSWPDTTLGDIAKKIASEHSLQPAVDPTLGSIKIEHEDQTESDMQFMSRLCAGIGCVFKVSDGKLIVAENYSGKSQSGKSMPKIAVSADQCSTWNASITMRGKYGKAKARWYDPKIGKPEMVEEGSDKPELLLSKTYPTEELAKKAAKSALKANTSSTGRLSVQGLKGNPDILAESQLQLSGFRVGVDELEWFVETVHHKLTKSGYICDIDAELKGTK